MSVGDEFSAEFPIVRKGYDPASVDAFLADLRRTWTDRVDHAEARTRDVERQLAEARENEEAIHLTLLAATQTRDDMLKAAKAQIQDERTAAQEEADRLLAEARAEALAIVAEAQKDARTAIGIARREGEDARSTTGREGASPAAARILGGASPGEDEAEITARMDRLRSATSELEERIRQLTAARSDEDAEEEEPAQVLAFDDTGDDDGEFDEPLTSRVGRGSFYSRRSAKLPRIGDDANTTMAAVHAMRGSTPDGRDEEDAMAPA
jgi:DivIVA domain-containing protein